MARIVVADSSELGRRYACELLQYDGHGILEAEDFEGMVAHLLFASVDVVLLDPGLQGLTEEGLRYLLRGPRALGPVIYLLAEGTRAELQERARSLGAEGAFVKGEDAVEIVRAIQGVAGKKGRAEPPALTTPEPWPSAASPHRPWAQAPEADQS